MKTKILNFFTNTLNGMAYGLFATLIVGTILSTLGKYIFVGNSEFILFLNKLIMDSSNLLQKITGAGIGIGIALMLKCNSLKTIVLASVGQMAAYFSESISNISFTSAGSWQIGDPLTVYFAVIIVALLFNLVLKKKTPVDILIVPLFGIIVGLITILLIRVPIIYVTYGIQFIVDKATLAAPFIMGIVVSVVMGMALTAPISSAAIAYIVFNGTGEGLILASGAAVVGCCTQMIGFAVQSRKDNNIGMVLSIGIGTSMLQFKNILKKPIIWLPTIITSAILGPISTCWLKLKCYGANNAGMGTAGLVGVIGTFNDMGFSFTSVVIILLIEIILPAIIVFIIDLIFRKFKLIKDGDLKVDIENK